MTKVNQSPGHYKEFSLFWETASAFGWVWPQFPTPNSVCWETGIFCAACSQLSLLWPFLLQFPLLGQTLAVQERKYLSVPEGGWLWPFLSSCLLKSLTSHPALFYSLRLGHQGWSSCLRTTAHNARARDSMQCNRKHQQSFIHPLVKGCKVSGYAWRQRNQGPRLAITETSQKDDEEGELWG